MTNKLLVLGLVTSLLVNAWLVFGAEKDQVVSQTEETENSYEFLAKRIQLNSPNDGIINFVPLREALRTYTDKYPGLHIFFEYLPTGMTIGVREKDELVQASLVKVPLVMAVYKKIGVGLVSMDQQLIIEEKHLNQEFGALWKRGVGASVSVAEAIELSLTESDNTAALLLADLLSPGDLTEVFNSMDVAATTMGDRPTISAKSYSSILKSLYFSSFLPLKDSNKVLEMLTRSVFRERINAGVPSDIKVAHKIGVYEDNGSVVYSDCGIVYLPQRNYLICVMAEGDAKSATEQMQMVSRMVYSYVERVK